MTAAYWRGKRVLITGHTGFKGSWLSIWLHEMHANVVGCALSPPPEKNLYTAAQVGTLIESHYLDIRDSSALTEFVIEAEPEIVFHLAAQPLVLASYENPGETYETNVLGTLNVLEAIRATASVNTAVIITSDKCYENREQHRPFRESDRLGGHDPYSSSKACAEILVASYRESYFTSALENRRKVRIATARAGNVIGGGDWSQNRLVPDAMRAIERGENFVLRNPDSVRPWQHVLESLAGYLLLAERLNEGEDGFARAWNFGPDESDVRSVKWIAERIVDLSESQCTWMSGPEPQLHEADILTLDSSDARAHLGWAPKWDITNALRKVVGWYTDERSGSNAQLLCRNHIRDYVGTAIE
jgi:CDP-glucose 4,6-dehydratase